MDDARTFRDGYLAGVALAVTMLRTNQECPSYNDAGEEFFMTPGECADEIESVMQAVTVGTKSV